VRRRRRRGVGVRKSLFCPQNDNFGCIFTQFLTGRSLETRILQFNYKTKLTKQCRNYAKKSRSDQGRRRLHNRLSEYATAHAQSVKRDIYRTKINDILQGGPNATSLLLTSKSACVEFL